MASSLLALTTASLVATAGGRHRNNYVFPPSKTTKPKPNHFLTTKTTTIPSSSPVKTANLSTPPIFPEGTLFEKSNVKMAAAGDASVFYYDMFGMEGGRNNVKLAAAGDASDAIYFDRDAGYGPWVPTFGKEGDVGDAHQDDDAEIILMSTNP